MRATLKTLYDNYQHIYLSDEPVPLSPSTIDELTLKALQSIFKAEDELVSKELFQITNDSLQQAITEVFGLEQINNAELITQLRTSAEVFSAFKAHNQAEAIANLLVDDKGNPRTFSQFKRPALKEAGKWNINWLKTEYNTAKARARTAEQFQKFEATKHLYPNLQWLPSRSAHPREDHRQLWGIIQPLDDPFWNTHYPGNIWNCKCSVRPTAKDPTPLKQRTAPLPTKGIDQNPVNGQIFTKTHPYYQLDAKTTAQIHKSARHLINPSAHQMNSNEKQ